MSKLKEFQDARITAERLALDVDKILGLDTPLNDKHVFSVEFVQLIPEMILKVQAGHGYYGSSSGYSDTSRELGVYLARAIVERHSELLLRAVELAWEAAENARQNAEAEAREVLLQTAHCPASTS